MNMQNELGKIFGVEKVEYADVVLDLINRRQPRANSQGNDQRIANRFALSFWLAYNKGKLNNEAIMSILSNVYDNQNPEEKWAGNVLVKNNRGFKSKDDHEAYQDGLNNRLDVDYWMRPLEPCVNKGKLKGGFIPKGEGSNKIARYWRQFINESILNHDGSNLADENEILPNMMIKLLMLEHLLGVEGYFVRPVK